MKVGSLFSMDNHKPHPAKYSRELLPILAKYCYGDIIDIMGGTGRAGLLKKYNEKIKSVTINELEIEWANQAKSNGVDRIIIGNAENLTGHYDCIVTSPPYGNRMADNFNAGSKGGKSYSSMRKRYAGDLGRTPSEGSICCLHFDKGYQEAMVKILSCVLRNVSPARIVWNTSNFIRNFKEVDVFSFFKKTFFNLGYEIIICEKVKTKRQKGVGANTHLRISHEDIAVYERLHP